MLVAISNYTGPTEEIDRVRPAHREFLSQYYEKGNFICSGGRQPRTGGVILARGLSPEELTEILKQDPFCLHGLSTYEVFEFQPAKHAPGFEAFL